MKNTFSIITKEEEVKSIDHHVLPNTLVLEIIHPFPGYYFGSSFINSESKPQSLLLILKKEISFEFFYRKLSRIHKYSEFTFGAELSEVMVYNTKYQAIRINSLEKYDNIITLQKYFIDEGFNLRKNKNISGLALIKVHKFISLEYEDGIYLSADNSHFIYFGINKELTWKQFEHITVGIRHNFNSKKYDAGLGMFFHNGDIENIIRIYSKDLNKDDINKLKYLYERELNNY